MRGIVSYFIKYPIVANLLMIVLFIFGAFGLFSLKSTFFPETESDVIKVQTTYPGASPEEMEEGVVLKIEDNLKGLTGIDRISSVSKENSASVTVEVKKGYNTDLILQDVKNAVDRISSFPSGMEPPEVFKEENLGFAISFALSGDVSLQALKEEARDIEDKLRNVEGISKVSLSGFPSEEIEVSLNETNMRAYNLTFDQVARAVRSANLEITGGTIEGEEEEMLIRARSKEYTGDALEDVVVKAADQGEMVRLKDIADVKDQWADDPSRTYLNGNPSVVVTVRNTIYQDILDITEHIRKFVEDFNQKNDVMEATVIRDRSTTIQQRINVLLKNGLIGFGLVLVLLSLFLNIRLAFWVAIAIPISFAGMFIIAAFYGITINVISLFGMILVIGILVDDGIVFSENIYQQAEKGKSPIKSAIDGTLEVIPPITASILTTVIVFSTFFFLRGQLGEFIAEMAFVVIFTLVFSLVEALFILPTHIGHSKALQNIGNKNWLNKQTDKAMSFLKGKIYQPFLWFCMTNKLLAIAIGVGLLLITIGAIRGGFIQTTFFPNIERDNVSVDVKMPAGTNEDITGKWLTHIEQAAWDVNEELSAKREDDQEVIKNIQKSISSNPSQGNLNIILLNSEDRSLPSYEITSAIREEAGTIVGAEKVSYGVTSPFGDPVSVALLGNNIEALEGAKRELKDELQKMSALTDVRDNDELGLREVNIELKDKAHLLGLNLQDVMSQVRDGFFGNEVQRLQRGLDEVKVWVRYGEQDRKSIGDLENMRIRLPNGNSYPLEEIATMNIERGVLAINHLYGMREIKVTAAMADPDASTSDINEAVRDNILPPILAKYPSVDVSFEGQSRETAKTSESASQVLPIILILMIAVVAVVFRSSLQTVVVFIILPFGFIGVGLGHFVHATPVSVLSAYGIIALIGIMVNNSLVFVTKFNNLMKEGYAFMTAVYEAGSARFRPILLTSLTTIGGLGPLILEESTQAQFLVPMAISIAYGMIVATFVSLIVLPVMLVVINHLRVYVYWLWHGTKPGHEELEPAVREMSGENEE